MAYSDETAVFRNPHASLDPPAEPPALRDLPALPLELVGADDDLERMKDEPVDPVPFLVEEGADEEEPEEGEEVKEEEEEGEEEEEWLEEQGEGEEEEEGGEAEGRERRAPQGTRTSRSGEPKSVIQARVRDKVLRWEAMSTRGEHPPVINQAYFLPGEAVMSRNAHGPLTDAPPPCAGFLLMLFRSLVRYAWLVSLECIQGVVSYRILHYLDAVDDGLLLSVLASRFTGHYSNQRGFLAAASDAAVDIRDLFQPQHQSDRKSVLYGRCGIASALLGGNRYAERPDHFGRYVGIAIGVRGFQGRGYGVSAPCSAPTSPTRSDLQNLRSRSGPSSTVWNASFRPNGSGARPARRTRTTSTASSRRGRTGSPPSSVGLGETRLRRRSPRCSRAPHPSRSAA